MVKKKKKTREEKAQEVIDADGVLPHENYQGLWWVQSSSGEKVYRVQFGESYVTCTCPHGMHKGGGDSTCYHVLAAERVRDQW